MVVMLVAVVVMHILLAMAARFQLTLKPQRSDLNTPCFHPRLGVSPAHSLSHSLLLLGCHKNLLPPGLGALPATVVSGSLCG